MNIQFNDAAREKFQNITSRLNAIRAQNANDPRARFAILLDGKVLSSPVSQAVISDGKPQITGNFTEQEAKALADQLKYGALPISFTIQSEQQISATLGSEQLRVGLLTWPDWSAAGVCLLAVPVPSAGLCHDDVAGCGWHHFV